MLISQGFFRVCKNHNIILLILLTLLEKLVTLLNLLKKNQQHKNFTWARAQVCHVHPTPMLLIESGNVRILPATRTEYIEVTVMCILISSHVVLN